MKASCEIIIEFENEKKVENVLKSTEVDNFNFVKTKTNGKKLEASIESKSVSSLIHTIDDYLACVSVAEKIVDKN
jgi:tRNA threonylcarbamoyladenosine modification (KEOPS) complex  Pcc1 subunit